MQFFKNPNYDFLGHRKIAFFVSATLILAGIISLILQGGPKLSIDFQGGTLLQIRFTQAVAIAQVRQAMNQVGFGDSEIQHFGSQNEVLIRVKVSEQGQGNIQLIRQALVGQFGKGEFEVVRQEEVGPKIGQELKNNATLAIFYAMLGIVVYISWRFEQRLAIPLLIAAAFTGLMELIQWTWRWIWPDLNVNPLVLFVVSLVIIFSFCWKFRLRYATGAIVALFHDVLFTVGAFSVLNLEVSLAVIAALLTIIGYSLNDTIVVFDRIRENIRIMKREQYEHIINTSINETLSRTIITAATTLFVLLVLFSLGGEVIRDFTFAMILGVIVGTYSSIYIASPVLVEWYQIEAKRASERDQTRRRGSGRSQKRRKPQVVRV